jgi:hypothetical protein
MKTAFFKNKLYKKDEQFFDSDIFKQPEPVIL